MSGDNFHIQVVSVGALEPVLDVAFRSYKAAGYQIGTKGMVFFWHMDDGVTPFPFEMDAHGAADFARRWLASADYGKQPDHDGDNGKGWCVYTDGWARVTPSHYSICAVKPAWIMYGK